MGVDNAPWVRMIRVEKGRSTHHIFCMIYDELDFLITNQEELPDEESEDEPEEEETPDDDSSDDEDSEIE